VHTKSKKNVLFIIADDLRPDFGAYGDSYAYTPYIDKLAKEGLTFKHAFTNFAACAPSRTSFMSGRLPDTTKGFTFTNDFREAGIGDSWRTLPQYFKEVGNYYTALSGKVFHPMLPPNNDYPKSWTAKPFTPNCRISAGCPDNIAEDLPVYPKNVSCLWGELRHSPYCAADVPQNETRVDKQLWDQRTRDSCIRQLREGAEQLRLGKVDGFFIACGFHKPHLSYMFPAEFLHHFRLHDLPEQTLKGYDFVPIDAPRVAWPETEPGWGQTVSRDFNATMSTRDIKMFRRANYATVSYIDDCIGSLLDVLDKLDHANDTLVVLTSDHSIALGEQGTWGKFSNFESSLKVPLIIRAPWIRQSVGKKTSALAELIDLYATMTELARLPKPRSMGEHINGTSLAPLMWNPNDRKLKTTAFSQMARKYVDNPSFRPLNIKRDEIEVMGYTLRERRPGVGFRYTAWFRFFGDDPDHLRIEDLLECELYKYGDGRGEVQNLAHDPKYFETLQEMHELLVSKIRVEMRSDAGKLTALPVWPSAVTGDEDSKIIDEDSTAHDDESDTDAHQHSTTHDGDDTTARDHEDGSDTDAHQHSTVKDGDDTADDGHNDVVHLVSSTEDLFVDTEHVGVPVSVLARSKLSLGNGRAG